MSLVICKLPRAGLGNQLFPLMNALVFARLNSLPVIVTGYHQLKIGPYLRKEKNKRRYKGYFTFQKNIIGEYLDLWKIKRAGKIYKSVYESEIKKLAPDEIKNKLFVFEKMPASPDYFIQLKDYRQEISEILYSILNPGIKSRIEQEPRPVIGVHIRMGDFRKLNEGEVYNSGHVRTPESYFINTIHSIRAINGTDLPVSVFTDGYKEEFLTLFNIKNVKMVEGNPDIADMLLLSRSQLIISTHGSTFSIWAAFLSNAVLISYFNYPQLIRPDHVTQKVYEGILDTDNELLIANIKSVG